MATEYVERWLERVLRFYTRPATREAVRTTNHVDMLKPEAIFTLFFTDVLFGEQMLDPDFAAAIQALPADVDGQIQTIIKLMTTRRGTTRRLVVCTSGARASTR